MADDTTHAQADDDLMGFSLWAAAHPGRPAIVDEQGRERTYGELLDDVNRVTHGLRNAAGLEIGDTIACVMTNSIEMMTLYLAAMQSGLYFVSVNYHLTASEISYIVTDSGAKAVVTCPRAAESVALALREVDHPVAFYALEGAPMPRARDDLVAGQPTALPEVRPAGSLMQYTSGTSGRPKGVKRPLSGLTADEGARVYKWLFDEYGMGTAFESWLVAAPMYHSANITPAAGALHMGGRLVLMRGWTPESFLETVERRGVTGTHLVPTQFHRLAQLPDDVRGSYDVSSVRFILHGAAPCSIQLKLQMFDWLRARALRVLRLDRGRYDDRVPEGLARPSGHGRQASAISELEIHGPAGEVLGPGETGVIYMRQGEDVFEYHNDPDKTASVRRGRLLTVGDLGYVDEEGFLYLTGRETDMIIVGGVERLPRRDRGRPPSASARRGRRVYRAA